ncbi:putative mitochondrial outer membrane protein [Lachnellula cervina]|uniref:Putative mitochondrial outer membrane protein n=1 Tax=Lachnellula cervina TaxID=1316786 RepID=A0A7D8UL51_9HELO|nr:putative mitochondrial outer membrane protein [Lachnellula cervina]
MPDLSLFSSPAPYHIITYGTLLGTEFFQSFVGGIVAFKALTRPQFSQLQQKIFPIYFSIQTALPVVLALTYPGSRNPLGPSSSLSGTLAESNRWSVLAPLATMFVGGLVNLVYVGPATTRIMRERKVQESKDGKKSYDPAPHSKEMQQLNRAFGKMHGVSSLVNLGALIATIWYGFSLAERIQ